jgi:hypothetical protein
MDCNQGFDGEKVLVEVFKLFFFHTILYFFSSERKTCVHHNKLQLCSCVLISAAANSLQFCGNFDKKKGENEYLPHDNQTKSNRSFEKVAVLSRSLEGVLAESRAC